MLPRHFSNRGVAMTVIKSNHDADLRLPQGPVVRAGKSIDVTNWDIVRGQDIVKAWIRAGAIEEVAEKVAKPKKSAPETDTTKE